jgi:hypothetical protein
MSIFGRNGNGNGRGAPVALGGALPILGLPATMRAVSVTQVLTCNCEAKTLLFMQGVPGVSVKCKACKRIFIFAGLSWKMGGQPEVNLQIAVDTDDALEREARAAAPPPPPDGSDTGQ